MYVSIVGICMLIVFTVLIVTKKVSVLTALIGVPILFGFIAGFGFDTFTFALNGVLGVSSTFVLLTFAILYFSIMLCAGLFDPLSKVVIRFMGGDPLKVVVGTAILSSLVSLDGDGTTTVMICATALLPVYTQLNIKTVYLALFITLPNVVINLLPWGGPTARVMSVLNVDSGELLAKLVPLMLFGILTIIIMSYVVGLKERKRLGGIVNIEGVGGHVEIPEDEKDFRRPQFIWFNFILTVVVLVSVITGMVSGPVAFGIGVCLALLVNYRNSKIQKKVIEYAASGIINVVLMIIGAGFLMGVLNESGMAEQISTMVISAIPESLGSAVNIIMAIIGGPVLWILNNDAFYFGIMPVFADMATAYGFTDLQIAIASLVGQALRASSPVVPAMYLTCQYTHTDVGEFQRKAIPFSLILMGAFFVAAFFLGALTV